MTVRWKRLGMLVVVALWFCRTAAATPAPESLGATRRAGAMSPSLAAASAARTGEIHPARRRFESKGIRLDVDASDLTLTRTAEQTPFFSLRAFETERFIRELAALNVGEEPSNRQPCTRRIEVTPLAWTGTFLSVRESQETDCGGEAHPSGESRFSTFSVDGQDKAGAHPISLKSWLPERAVFRALAHDGLVRNALTQVGDKPVALADLVTVLAQTPPQVSGRACYAFPEDLLDRFVPSHLEHGKLAIRLSLSGAGVCRTNLTELGILVPLPAALAANLSEAASGQSGGFLKRNASRELAQHPVVIELTR